MTVFKTHDQYISTILKTKFHDDKNKFIEAIKILLQKDDELETREYNLLKAYMLFASIQKGFFFGFFHGVL